LLPNNPTTLSADAAMKKEKEKNIKMDKTAITSLTMAFTTSEWMKMV